MGNRDTLEKRVMETEEVPESQDCERQPRGPLAPASALSESGLKSAADPEPIAEDAPSTCSIPVTMRQTSGPENPIEMGGSSILAPGELKSHTFDSLGEYHHSSLSERGRIRLLRLMPHEDDEAPIQCQLFEYPLQKSGKRTHLYEALSYAWGPADNPQYICIQSDGGNSRRLSVTANLHMALSSLRDCYIGRIIWIDAICIDQKNKEEKGEQVQFMTKIYAQAVRVIVWLGDAAAGSDEAIREIQNAGIQQHPATNEPNQQAILALLKRPWFERIWVLQEVAAARQVLIKCGSMEIDGYAFCSGLNALKPYKTLPDLQSLISPIIYLIRGTVFRPRYETSPSGGVSLYIRPLSELVDMFHTRKATEPLDKVYALLGISSNDASTTKLSPNYMASWKEVFRKLINLSISDQMAIETWDEKVVAVIKGNGCILGQVSSVEGDVTRDDRQSVGITWKNALNHFNMKGKTSSQFTFQVSAKSIRVGDVVCLLQGASRPTIIRPCNQYSDIVIISVPLDDALQSTSLKWSRLSQSITIFPNALLLVWDWDVSRGQLHQGESYESFMSSRDLSNCSKTQFQDYLDKAIRLWNFGGLLQESGSHEESGKCLQEAMRVYKMVLRGVENTSPHHSPWVELLDGYVPLSLAAWSGHEDEVRLLLDKGVDIEAKSSFGGPPLLWAARNGHEAIVRLLLDKGADIEAKDGSDRTPLLWAAENGHEAVVRLLLLNHGINIEAASGAGETPLWHAARNGHETVVRLLLDKGADIEAKDGSDRTPLLWAAEKGHEAIVRLLLNKGANIEAQRRYNGPPLSHAAAKGHEATVRLLLDRGAEIEAEDHYGGTPLLHAVMGKSEAVVQLLLDEGAAIEAKSHRDGKPLLQAAKNGHEALVRLLLDRGADAETKSSNALPYAAMNGHEAVVRLLLDKGIDIEAGYPYSELPLILAAENGHEPVVRLLLNRGANIESTRTSGGLTPLLCAVRNGHEDVVRLLIEIGADTEVKSGYGGTSLSQAAGNGHEAVVRLLLDKGVDIEAILPNSGPPLSHAAGNGHEAIVRLLLDSGANIEARGNYGRMAGMYELSNAGGGTPLSHAARGGHEAIVRLLLNKGADIEAISSSGGTPLLHAAEEGHKALVQLFLDKGANVEVMDNSSGTALSYATENQHEAVMRLLQPNRAQVW